MTALARRTSTSPFGTRSYERVTSRLEPGRVVHRAFELDLALSVPGARQLHGDEARLFVVPRGPDDQVRDAVLHGVDDDVGQLAVGAVGAVDASAELEAHIVEAFHARASARIARRG
jgi:hypothetical protein